jgi:NAD(P)-dependent dehydrogenase (short-subunit alcohol dehydrogenase family)
MNNRFSIKNKVIIVTGSRRGIGKAFAEEFTKEGAIVYAISKSFSRINNERENNLHKIKCDLKNKKEFENICKKIFETHKKIDVLINNAGISLPQKNKEKYSLKDWNLTLETNLTSVFNSSQAVINFMRKNNQGSIINITSINAQQAFPENPAYVSSKGGLKMLSKAFARDWGKYGIRVNNLAPGYINTDMNRKTYSNKKTRKNRADKTMLGRWGTTEDLLGAAIFLASDSSKYITAQDIYIDGGWISNGL